MSDLRSQCCKRLIVSELAPSPFGEGWGEVIENAGNCLMFSDINYSLDKVLGLYYFKL